jgi:hypothetical protein
MLLPHCLTAVNHIRSAVSGKFAKANDPHIKKRMSRKKKIPQQVYNLPNLMIILWET